MSTYTTPVVKWLGGKRQLLPALKKYIPNNFNKYYEPFFGGGALFFYLNPKQAVINDSNIQLMGMYKNLRDEFITVKSYLDSYQYKYNSLPKEQQLAFYYILRNKYNQKISNHINDAESAALLIFLNKSGFNGLYRVNKKGQYNVPFAHKSTINLYNENNLQDASRQLQNAHIMTGDFEDAVKSAGANDLVFFDSPYFQTFDSYQAGGFSVKDHKRLAHLFNILTKRGTKCILTNSDTDFIKALYHNYHIEKIPVKRLVNRDAKHRTGQEIIITNFEGDQNV